MTPQNRILVTGGRDFDDYAAVSWGLEKLNPQLVIQGGASGADMLAREWCSNHGVPCVTMHAAWMHYGKSAGPRRNRWMFEILQPTAVLAFPGGRGTENCKRAAERFHVPVVPLRLVGEDGFSLGLS